MALILLLGAMGIGCGDTSNARRSAGAAVTKEEAIAFAQAVNLRAADVSGLGEMSIPSIHSRPKLQAELARCAGVANSVHHRIGLFPSHRFGAVDSHHQVLYVLSGVSVWTRPGFATAQHASDTSRGRSCTARFMPRLARLAPGVSAAVHVLPDLLPNIGATEMRMRVERPLTRRPSYLDLLSFLCGPAEVELVVTAGPRAAKPWTEKKLLARLYSRARTSELISRVSGSASGC